MQGYKSIVIVMKTLYCLWLTRKSEIRQCCNAIMVYINFARIILIALKSCIAIKPLVSCSIIHIFYISYALSPTLTLFMFCVCHIWVQLLQSEHEIWIHVCLHVTSNGYAVSELVWK